VTKNHPAGNTHPLRVGAPLPPSTQRLPSLSLQDIDEELYRAEVELLYATAKHRKCWAAMRRHADHRAELAERPYAGGLASLEADSVWKKRTGDVAWWRDEMAAQATTILALRSMREARTPIGVPSAATRAAHSRADTTGAPSDMLFGWPDDGAAVPTRQQYDTARNWLAQNQARKGTRTGQVALSLMETYERHRGATGGEGGA
jgi:hypothetical protein